MRGLVVGLTLALMALGTSVRAEDVETDTAAGVFFGGSPGSRVGYHASTWQEGVQRGAADVIRSRGEYNRQTAKAAVDAAVARRYELENVGQAIHGYYSLRQAAREYRAEERGPKPTVEAMRRYSQARVPDRLSPAELDVLTGEISWPLLLRSEELAELRAELDALFDRRAIAGKITAEEYLRIRELVDAIEAALKAEVSNLPLHQYAASKRFLKSLAYEAQRPVGHVSSVAQSEGSTGRLR